MDEKVDNPALLFIIIKKTRKEQKNAKRHRETIEKSNGVASTSAFELREELRS